MQRDTVAAALRNNSMSARSRERLTKRDHAQVSTGPLDNHCHFDAMVDANKAR